MPRFQQGPVFCHFFIYENSQKFLLLKLTCKQCHMKTIWRLWNLYTETLKKWHRNCIINHILFQNCSLDWKDCPRYGRTLIFTVLEGNLCRPWWGKFQTLKVYTRAADRIKCAKDPPFKLLKRESLTRSFFAQKS